MLFNDTYITIAGPAEGIFKDRGSKFIGLAYPIKSEEEIKPVISALRTEHPKARHFCWAIRLTPDRTIFRLNDDGEPAGSAGRPILNVLLSKDVTNLLVVVVRYFGGTLLGVPGLINAYKTASIMALENSEMIEKTLNDVYAVDFPYAGMNEVMKVIKEENLSLLSQHFDLDCQVEIEIRKSNVNQVVGKLQKIENITLKFTRTI